VVTTPTEPCGSPVGWTGVACGKPCVVKAFGQYPLCNTHALRVGIVLPTIGNARIYGTRTDLAPATTHRPDAGQNGATS
jgi:hypothetical protein